jgi:predicted metal-dependent peptidase
MAVDDFNNIYINPLFSVFQLSLEECSGVLAHEATHIFRKHFFRVLDRDRYTWNIATDFNINMNLLRDGHKLPAEGCIPVNKGSRWVIPTATLKSLDPTYKGGEFDITDLAAEEIYAFLKKNVNMQQPGEGQGGQGGQPGEGQGGQGGQPGEGQGEGQPGEGQGGQPGEGQGGQGKGKVKNLDDHIYKDGGDGTPEVASVNGEELPGKFKPRDEATDKGEREAQAENIKKKSIEEANKEHKGGGGRGTGTGVPEDLQIEEKVPTVDWRTILRKYLTLGAKTYYDMKKPNKRALAAGYYAPRMVRVQNRLDALITLDTSGSISDGAIKVFVSEVLGIIKAAPHIRALIVFWESHAYSPLGSKPFFIQGDQMSLDQARKSLSSLRISRGGTNLSSVVPYYNKIKSTVPDFKPQVMVTFTDGMIEAYPQLPTDIPFDRRIFLINNLGGRGGSVLVGDDSIVKKAGKWVYGVKVEG